jgi:hypothetical protein
MFEDAEKMEKISEKIEVASQEFAKIAEIEQEAYGILTSL